MPKLLSADGVALHYDIEGRGRPLVFVHGWCSSSTTWERQIESLAPSHQVVALDRRGHGRSGVPPTGYSADLHATDLLAVMTAEGLAGGTVVAHAGGAPAVLQAAVERPDVIGALAIVECDLYPRPTLSPSGDEVGRIFWRLLDRLGSEPYESVMRSVFRTMFDQTTPLEIIEQACDVAVSTPLGVAVDCLRFDICAVDVRALARQLVQPVLYIRGDNAAAFELADVRKVMPHARVAVLAGARHFPQAEAPDQLTAAVRWFTATLPEPCSREQFARDDGMA